jgi:anti-sigma factor RsiW
MTVSRDDKVTPVNLLEGDPFEISLKAWIDGELEPTRAIEVARHVEGCRRCQATVRDFRTLTGLLGRLPEESPDQALTYSAQIASQVREEENVIRLVRTVAVSAAAVLVLSVGWLMSTPSPLVPRTMSDVGDSPLILVISDTPWEDEF